MKAIWNGKVIAESNSTISLEGNVYFPEKSVKKEFLTKSETRTSCLWKGKARYYNLIVRGKKLIDAAWYYPKPSMLARKIRHHIAFWRGVEISA